MDINKNSSTPIYLQLKELIERQIARQELLPGSRVMSEAEVSEAFDVSRITVRKAYGELVDEGYLVRKKGKGTFVRDIRYRESLSATSFTGTCKKLGLNASSKMVESGTMRADARLARILGVEEGMEIAHMARLRYANGIPVRLERNYYAPQYSGIIEENLEGSISAILQNRYRVNDPKQIHFTIEIRYATKQESELLGIKKNSAMLKANGTLYDERGEPVYHTEMLHLPDRCVLEV